MSEGWFEEVNAETPLTQGDIVTACPVLAWSSGTIVKNSAGELQSQTDAFVTDAIVMTQACDLDQNKVHNVILCPCQLLTEFRSAWEKQERLREQNPTTKKFRSLCEQIARGYQWNLAILNHSGTTENPGNDHRVVNFHEIYTLPKTFLENLIAERNTPRLRLRSPYREHLSQSFARLFMRVGLPVGVTDLHRAGE